MTASPYGERRYRRARANLSDGLPCWHGCGRPATTIDHVPALAQHHHQPGGDCCALMPCCAPCNYASGARLSSRQRHPSTSRRW